MARPKRIIKCKGCGKEFQAPNKRSQYHSQKCYLKSTRENRLKFHNAIFNDAGKIRRLEIEEAYRAIDQKYEDKYGKGSF